MSTFSGALSSKRKADLVEIAQALGVPEADAKITDLIKSIQSHLDSNQAELSQSPRFKGLYGRRNRTQSSDDDTPDAKQVLDSGLKSVEGTARKSRKSVNKVLDKVANAVDPANIALPETPINLARVQRAAENAVDAAQEQLSVALAPAQDLIQRGDFPVQLRDAQNQLISFGHNSKLRVERATRLLQHHLSRPEHLVGAALGIEFVFLLSHITQFYDHTVFFPPTGGETGTFAALLHSLFFWLPSFSSTYRLPDIHGFRPGSALWPSVAWWTATTVLPPYALSTLISFVPQKGIARKDHATRYSASHPPTPTSDPLTFALIRLAILLYPLTDAAPSSFVNSLELTGNLQVRALGAGLLAALLLVNRLSS